MNNFFQKIILKIKDIFLKYQLSKNSPQEEIKLVVEEILDDGIISEKEDEQLTKYAKLLGVEEDYNTLRIKKYYSDAEPILKIIRNSYRFTFEDEDSLISIGEKYQINPNFKDDFFVIARDMWVKEQYYAQVDITDIATIGDNDFASLSRNANYEAKLAIKKKDYDRAWKYISKQALYIMQMNFDTRRLFFNAFAVIYKQQANVLRLEKKHLLALRHYILFLVSDLQSTKANKRKLSAYWKRAGFNLNTIYIVEKYINENNLKGWADSDDIKKQILKWQEFYKKGSDAKSPPS